MREIYQDVIIPDFIVRPVEIPTLGSRAEIRLLLRADFDYRSRGFLKYCMTTRDLGPDGGVDRKTGEKTALRVFFESTTFVMNIWEDPEHPKRWLGGRFTAEQYLDLVNRVEDPVYRAKFHKMLGLQAPSNGKVYVAQYGKAKWPTGGGRNAHAAGKFFYGEKDVMDGLYRDYLLVDPEQMDPRERVSRSALLFTNPRRFSVPPRIVLSDYETGGTAIVDTDYAEREGIEHGDKLWPVKASAVVSKLHIEGADMLIPKDAIKFKEHRDASVLSPLMGAVPELSAKMRSSTEKDRLPKLAFDTMQWLFPELEVLLSSDARFLERMALVRKVVEGQGTVEEMVSFGEYTDPKGEVMYPNWARFLLNGHPKEDPSIRTDLLKAAGSAATRALCFKTPGEYGVAMPLSDESTEITLLMPPWMLPFRVHGSTKSKNVVCAESDFVIGFLGKDYDGDLGMALKMDGLLRRLGLPQNTFLSWNDEKDRAWMKRFMVLPEKKKEAVGRSVHQVMADGIKSYGLIGVATNACTVILDAMRATGLYTREQLMGIYLRMMSAEVQPFVDALKYDPAELVAPRLETKYRGHKVLQLGLAEKYGIDPRPEVEGRPNPGYGKPIPGIEKLAVKVQSYFRAVRGMNFEALSELPEDAELNRSFYYRLSRLFVGWKVYKEVDITEKARILAAKYPIAPELEARRAGSFLAFKGKGLTGEVLAKARWGFICQGRELPDCIVLGLLASCWLPNKKGNRDTYLGSYIGRVTGADIVTGTIQAKEEEQEEVLGEVVDTVAEEVVTE